MAKKKTSKSPDSYMLTNRVIKRQESIVRQDLQDWKNARQLAEMPSKPRNYKLQRLYSEVMLDGLMSAQITNLRIGKTQGAERSITNADGTINEEQTTIFNTLGIYEKLVKYIVESQFYGYSLIELSQENGLVSVELVPRMNVVPQTGDFYTDYLGNETIPYRELNEYGKTLIEIYPDNATLGQLNKAVPYVLMKKFAMSCWSELCEIFGIPPRVLKTNTADSDMLNRAENMMREIGSAAYFIIDTDEELDFTQGSNTDGSVYKNLITTCNEQLSLLNLGAVIGTDTEHGNYSKEESSQKLLESIIRSDKKLIETVFNRQILPCLAEMGLMAANCRLKINQEVDITQLWQITSQALPYFEFDTEWLNSTFGLRIIGKKTVDNGQLTIDNFKTAAKITGEHDFF